MQAWRPFLERKRGAEAAKPAARADAEHTGPVKYCAIGTRLEMNLHRDVASPLRLRPRAFWTLRLGRRFSVPGRLELLELLEPPLRLELPSGASPEAHRGAATPGGALD